MRVLSRPFHVVVCVLASFALTVGLRGNTVTVTPGTSTLLVGQSASLTASGAIVPTAISVGGWHSCVIYSDQSVRCVGLNNQGEIGNGTYASVNEPALANGTVNPTQLNVGFEHSCTLVGDGRMQCWGSDYTGQLGDNSFGGFAEVPQFVQNLTNAIKAVSGGYFTCAILSDHTASCWGRNQDGQLGNGDATTDTSLPGPVQNLGPVGDLFAGGYHTCALFADGTAKCWGRNGRGQVGDGTDVSPVTTPHAVVNLSSAATLALGGYHSCALMRDGTVQCWGQSDHGQIGAPGLAFSGSPVTVQGISGATAVAGGALHTCAVLGNGTAWCWGQNDHGQLGDGTTNDSASPVQVQGLANAVSISLGWGHSCALKQDGSVWCWGENDYGELGNGTTTTSSFAPVLMHQTGLTWTTSDATVATVSATGVVTGVARGTATITATDAFGNSGSATVSVRSMLTLNVLRQGDGVGTVTSSPSGISCPGTCAGSFVSDSQVVLTAAAGADSVFTGWTGCDSVSGAACTVAMSNARSVTAIFMLKRFTLTTSTTGIGKGTVTSSPAGINCGSACASDFVINTKVTLTATPGMLSVFSGWTGCDSSSGSTCTVTMTANKSASAQFTGVPLF